MGLTSKKVLLLAVVLAVVLFAVTVWLWPRLARRGVLPVLGRVGTLLVTQVSLISALALFANYSFGFYASWADLLGQETAPGVVVDNVAGGAGGAMKVVGTLPVNVSGGAVPRVGGQLQKIEVTGGLTKITTTAYVYLPPEYFREPQRVFPASLVFTGYPGVAEALFKKMKYPGIEAAAVRSGRAQPIILVMMRPTVVPPRDTECMNVPRGPQVETFFAQDLRAALLTHYRIGAGPRSWAVMGDSTGGYCALKLTLEDPDAFSTAVALSADYAAPKDPTTGDLFGGSKQVRSRNNLVWRLQHLPQPPVSMLVTSSRHGEKNYRATQHFVSLVRGPARISSIILPSGGHNFGTWAREIPPAIQWMSQRLTPDAPSAPAPRPRPTASSRPAATPPQRSRQLSGR